MSDSLRVRLGFKNFSNPDLRNTLLSFKKSDTKTVKNLQKLIQKRYKLSENILLLIGGFVVEPAESIDVVRDDDLIIIEPKVEVSNTKVKTERKFDVLKTRVKNEPKSEVSTPKVKTERKVEVSTNKVKTELKIKSEKNSISNEDLFSDNMRKYIFKNETPKPKTHQKTQKLSKEYISSDSSSDSEVTKVFVDSDSSKSRTEVKPIAECGNKPISTLIGVPLKTYSKSLSTEIVSTAETPKEPEITSMRNIPLRKAFQDATTSLKKRPLTSNDSTSTASTPKPKRRRTTKEAREPVDRFSPVIILERKYFEFEDKREESYLKNVDNQSGLPVKEVSRKQSARKSFPNPSRNTSIKNNSKPDENGIKNEKQLKDKSIDFDNCEPLISVPVIGDIIAFKMLTLSADGNGYESSPFKMGVVLYVNEDTQMVDILLQDVIKKKNLETLKAKDEQLHEIHSLKINWSTVLEPKIIQRQSEPELIIL